MEQSCTQVVQLPAIHRNYNTLFTHSVIRLHNTWHQLKLQSQQ